MLTSEVAVLKSRHGISVKCYRYRDTGTTDPSLNKTSTNVYKGSCCVALVTAWETQCNSKTILGSIFSFTRNTQVFDGIH